MNYSELKNNLQIAGCTFRWNYSVVKLNQLKIRTCCQVSTNESAAAQDVQSVKEDLFLNSDYLVQRKLEMLKGIKHEDCKPCWKLEENSIRSMRSSAESFDSYLSLDSLASFKKNEFNDEDLIELARFNKVNMLEIQLDNICDLACMYCNSEYSTTWAKKLGQKITSIDSDTRADFKNLFWQWYKKIHTDLNGLCIIGGEPLASPNFPDVLGQLKKIHSENAASITKQQFLSITSNFNANETIFNKFLSQLNELKPYFNLSINASCESIQTNAEFIREGLVWSRFEKNVHSFLKFIQKNNSENHPMRIDFSFHSAQNALSISCLPAFLKWAIQLENEYQIGINLIQNIVSYPAHFSAQSILPSSFSKYCDEALDIISSHKARHRYVDNATWPLYADFIRTIKVGLESRTPDENITAEFKKWYFDLSDDRKNIFKNDFNPVYEQIILT